MTVTFLYVVISAFKPFARVEFSCMLFKDKSRYLWTVRVFISIFNDISFQKYIEQNETNKKILSGTSKSYFREPIIFSYFTDIVPAIRTHLVVPFERSLVDHCNTVLTAIIGLPWCPVSLVVIDNMMIYPMVMTFFILFCPNPVAYAIFIL